MDALRLVVQSLRAPRVQVSWLCWSRWQGYSLACNPSFYSSVRVPKLHPLFCRWSLHLSKSAAGWLGLHLGPQYLEQGLSQKLLPLCGICSSRAALSGFSGEDAPSLAKTWCARVGRCPRATHSFREGEGNGGGILGGGYQEQGSEQNVKWIQKTNKKNKSLIP